ncbi:MAG: hypothetical protein KGI06_04330 [Candidatus Micrarchaeota archaeon]|nr:hypothetical protein [Candidatus Micrarchaeota archaeon]
MDYGLGVVGLGHWFNRLNIGIQKVGGLSLMKAVGTKPFDQKAEVLQSFGITRDNYYIADKGKIPDGFFNGIDVVHISDPNRFHAQQIQDSLEHGKYTITEKSLATNRREFGRIASFIRKSNSEGRVYLHLHYVHKQPSLMLKDLLPGLVGRYGRIREVKATFFEKASEEDSRRTWLFAPENGGIFMDWVHPFEVLYDSTGSTFGHIKELSLYATNLSYDGRNPTGVRAIVETRGRSYSKGALAEVNVAKGVDGLHDCKSIKVTFENGLYARLCYVGAGVESASSERGTLEIAGMRDGSEKVIMSSRLSGPNPYEIFVEDIIGLCRGNKVGFGIKDIGKIFKPQWEYQRLSKSRELIRNNADVSGFLEGGVSGMGYNNSE